MKNNNKSIVVIVNHNYNDNAIMLKMMFSKHIDTIIIDSGSDKVDDEFDIKLPNVGYSGLFNKAFEVAVEKKVDGLLFICSDVCIKKNQTKQIVEKINKLDLREIGVYSPSSRGQSHTHCKKKGDNIRDVVFVEGFIFYASMDILKEVYPVDLEINKLGYGLDVHKGLICLNKKKRCIIDDSIEIYHREGTDYNTNTASVQFINYMNKNKELGEFWELYHKNNCDSDLLIKNLNDFKL